MDELKPECIIALGFELWNNLPDLGGAPGPKIVGAGQVETWRYPYAGGSALAYGILHPSSGGFSGHQWYPHIMEAIKLA